MAPKFECDCCRGRRLDKQWTRSRPAYRREVERHMARYTGGFDQVSYSRSVDDHPVNLYVAGPTKERPCCVALTAGLSNFPMTVPEGGDPDLQWAELSICLPPDWRFTRKAQRKGWWWWPIRELLHWARYPRQTGNWLWYHHTVGGPEPLAPNLPFASMLLHPSLVLPEEYWKIPVAPGKDIWVLSLYPLHPDEYRLWQEHGAHALIDLLEDGGVTDLFDPTRKSVLR